MSQNTERMPASMIQPELEEQDGELVLVLDAGTGMDVALTGTPAELWEVAEQMQAALPLSSDSWTPNGYDATWIAAINRALADRGSDVRIVDLDEDDWDNVFGPMIDRVEDGKIGVR